MLSLLLKSGEYLTIGEDVVVQIMEKRRGVFQVSIQAPKEVPIVRGDLLDRAGRRPEGVYRSNPDTSLKRSRDAEQVDAEGKGKENM